MHYICLIIYIFVMSTSHKSNNLVRQVLKQIISDPPTSNRTSHQIDQIKLTEVATYLQRKIDRQQAEIKVLSQQLGKQIEAKEHLIMLLNEEKDKNCKITQHLNNANRNAAENKKKLAKFELFQNREAKIKEECELKLAKCRDILRKKDQLLAKANARIEEYEKSHSSIGSIQVELKDVREKMLQMKRREQDLLKENQLLKAEVDDQREQMHLKDQTILFSEEHLRRLREEYEQLQYDQYKEQEESRQLQLEMKELLSQQNQQIKSLNERINAEREACNKCDHSLSKSQICAFMPEKPQWELTVFKNELKRVINGLIRQTALQEKVEAAVMGIFEAVETSFNSILSQVMSGLE